MPLSPLRLSVILTFALFGPLAAKDTSPPAPSHPNPSPVEAPGFVGPYLAARQATIENDFRAAARYYSKAMQVAPDVALENSALISFIAAGEMDPAVTVARQMLDRGHLTDLARVVLRADLTKKEDWAGFLAFDKEHPFDGPEPPLGEKVITGWATIGAGQAGKGIARIEALAKDKYSRALIAPQLGLAKALVGDLEGAEKEFARPDIALSLPILTARIEVLALLDRRAEAKAILESMPEFDTDPTLASLYKGLSSEAPVSFDVIRNAAQGIAQTHYAFGAVLAAGDEPDLLALVETRLATWLDPTLTEARIISAELLLGFGQFDLAQAEYRTLHQQGLLRPGADLSRIESLARADRMADATAAARDLIAARPDLAAGWLALGDLQRREGDFKGAVASYDKGIALLEARKADQAMLWFPLYARGIAHERAGQWPEAEADFQAALKLQPDNPDILNYLGYSYLDRNIKLDEAMRLIQKAHELKPGDGYITDSLAWALYRTGRYAEAVAPMEEAVGLMSGDPLVNDHLGDVYWKVGRDREAMFQWRRALSYHPEKPEDARRIRAKIAVGLDAVLAAEQANGGTLPEGFAEDGTGQEAKE